MNWIHFICCNNKLEKYESYISIINNVITDLNKNNLENKKDYKLRLKNIQQQTF